MATQEFDPGPVTEPFKSLATTFPGDAADEYPQADFRTEWGPIFHRGRLDRTARILAIGQDPGQHENVLRRILSGEAGRRVQGFFKKLGITRSYVLINALLYSVYGSHGSKYVAKPKVRDYRNAWIDAILAPGKIQAVVTFGAMAKTAWDEYVKVKGAPAGIKVANLTHPTFPESAGGTKAERLANTKKMLTEWNVEGLQIFFGSVTPDVPTPSLVPYDADFVLADKVDIPSFDLPEGIPPWMFDNDGWARRVGETALEKRANITITVPKGIIK
jgi:uracil-DNA glycosylase